jgi:hypothetical protein
MLITLLFIAGLFIFCILNVLYKRSWHYYFSEEQHCNRIKDGTWDIVNLGSSYSRYGFDYEGTGLKGYNLGFSAQFFYYTNLMLKQYSRYFNENCIVLIIVPDLCFAREGKGFYNSDRYIKMIDKELLQNEYTIWKYFFNVVFPIIGKPRLLLSLFKEYFNIMRGERQNCSMLIAGNPYDRKGAFEQAQKRCNSWCRQFSLLDTQSDTISDELDSIFPRTQKILTNMIQYCIDRGFRPVLVVTPVSCVLNSLLSEGFLKRVLFDNIEKANLQNIPILNYLKDDRFQDIRWYLNSDMLNLNGRWAFTKVVIEDLKHLGYLT